MLIKRRAILYQIDTLAKDALKDMYTQYIEMSQKGGKGIYQDIKDKIVEDILRIRPFEACTTDIKTQFDELLTELATTTEEIISKTITDIRKGFGLILKQGEEKIDPKKFAKARKTLGTMLDNTRAILEKTIAVGDTDISDEPEGEQEVEGDGKDEEDEGMEKLTDTISGETPMAMAVDTASSSMVRAE